MGLPLFPPGEDPGPSFAALIRQSDATRPLLPVVDAARGAPPSVAHGTTVVALRYVDGVVMAGDRRATEGNVIAHRSMEKVFPADRYSAVKKKGARLRADQNLLFHGKGLACFLAYQATPSLRACRTGTVY